MTVKDPDGTTWCVRRRWWPWRRQLRGYLDLPSFPDLGDDPISMVVGLVLLILFLPFVVIFLIAGLELFALLLLLPFALLARVAFGRHWRIDVFRQAGPLSGEFAYEMDGGSWRTSRERIAELAAFHREHVPDPDGPTGWRRADLVS